MHLRKALRKWGNAYGIMISRSEAEELGAGAGALVDIDVRRFRPTTVADLPSMDAGTFDRRTALADALREEYDGGD